jgi:hypothetical protein
MISIRKFVPHDSVVQDDALHKRGKFGRVETWYYDALFENNYSIVSLVNILHMSCFSIVITSMFIYRNTELVKCVRQRIPIKSFYGSEEELLIEINGRKIIHGYIDENSNRYLCMISRGDNNFGFNLEFVKTAKAWKGKTFLGDWLVIPRFNVNGMLFIDGKGISVSGEGYHDHNIYPIYAPLINKGYHFGKIPFDSMNITWAHVTRNRDNEEIILVLNKDKEYNSINPRGIQFEVKTFVRDHGKIIPAKCFLKVEDNLLNLNIEMESLNLHYTNLPLINYWRYHIRYKGHVQIDSFFKRINVMEISEYLRFF